jgi:iron complex transport system ATP-binding protein
MIKVRHISVTFPPRQVLRDVSFALEAGRILAIVGPNGAGKTTLLKTLNQTIDATAGWIEIGGRPLVSMPRREIAKAVAVVAQENEMRFPITVLEFVLAGRFASGGAFGWESDADINAAREAISECDLEGFESRLMNELSGGERQRVVLARAIATGAKILLLDEPTANLDLAHQASMFRLIRKRCHDQGYSAVVIAHDLNLVAQFADEVLMLKGGAVLAHGAPIEVLTKENVKDVFGVDVLLDANPLSGGLRVTHILN